MPGRLRPLARAVSPALRRWLLNDRQFLEDEYAATFGRVPDLTRPVSFNEKVNWRKLHDRNRLHELALDKVAVRDYVAARVDPSYLVPILGVFARPEDIPWAELPAPYVVKASHGSGWNIFVGDPSDLDLQELVRTLQQWLRTNYYPRAREWAYRRIPRRLVVERFLGGGPDKVPEDYKFFCFDGVPRLVQVDYDRFTHHTRTLYDTSWRALPVEYAYPPGQTTCAPSRLPELTHVASELSQDFDFVRVDLYCVDDRVYFGELTIYPEAGFGRFTPSDWDEWLGSFWRLPHR